MFKNALIYITFLVAFLRSSCWDKLISINIYYSWFALLAIILIASSLRERKYDITTIIFISIAALSIMLNVILESFRPWSRLMGFSLLLVGIGPLIQTTFAVDFRVKLFRLTNIMLVVATVISFLGYFYNTEAFFGKSGFNGLMNQSMMLGPIASLASLISLHLFFNSHGKILKILHLVLFAIGLITGLLAASRGAFAALLVSIISYFVVGFNKELGKIFKSLAYISIIIVATSSFWLPYSEVMQKKQLSRKESNNIFSNREGLWEDRFSEFKSSPVYGIGFSSMNVFKNTKLNDKGIVEPGSSWLFILSTMGILGFITFFYLMLYPIHMIYVSSYSIKSPYPLLAAILLFFSFHMGIEGYALSSGGFLFVYLWLCIGLVQKRVLDYLY